MARGVELIAWAAEQIEKFKRKDDGLKDKTCWLAYRTWAGRGGAREGTSYTQAVGQLEITKKLPLDSTSCRTVRYAAVRYGTSTVGSIHRHVTVSICIRHNSFGQSIKFVTPAATKTKTKTTSSNTKTSHTTTTTTTTNAHPPPSRPLPLSLSSSLVPHPHCPFFFLFLTPEHRWQQSGNRCGDGRWG